MIGIGRLKHPSESSGQIINTLKEGAETCLVLAVDILECDGTGLIE
ncbi:hypothetical protein glysoja_009024 [Glycine soja]|nr:hypothetical protein glysoja_009024 [Glycine soja]